MLGAILTELVTICGDTTGFERHLDVNSDVLLGSERLMRTRWGLMSRFVPLTARRTATYILRQTFGEAPVGATGNVGLGFGVVRQGGQCHSWL